MRAKLAARCGAVASHQTLRAALLGSALLWAALPPLGLWPLAWVAPVAWVWLTRLEKLPGRRPYVALWFAGFCFWMATLHWLRLPHPATAIGWVALSSYLGCYLPVFVALVRVAVHRLGWPVVLAAPVVWTGLELAQAHLLTGFSMANLGHTQYPWLTLIQISDLAGGYGVSFVVMWVAACLARLLPGPVRGGSGWALAPLAVMLAAALGYGQWRLSAAQPRRGPTIALVQGSIDTKVKADPLQAETIFSQYLALSEQVRQKHDELDLIVWPETMYRDSLVTYSLDAQPPAEATWTLEDLINRADDGLAQIKATALRLDAPLLLGIDTVHYGLGDFQRYNSALHVDRNGRPQGRYDKMHPVMFGEYIPLGDHLPWLYQMTPLGGGLDAGKQAEVFEVGQVRLAANICYESILAHLVRRQVCHLRRRGQEPDVLVNLTNDGWFLGSSELDLHLICGVFRAVECRKPFLIAANTGFSAWIDADGRIRQRGPRRETGWIVAQVGLDNRVSPYLRLGDWPVGICLLACGLLGCVGLTGVVKGRTGSGQSS